MVDQNLFTSLLETHSRYYCCRQPLKFLQKGRETNATSCSHLLPIKMSRNLILFALFFAFLAGAMGQGLGANIKYVSNCANPIKLVISNTAYGTLPTLSKGQSYTAHYNHDVSFNVKVGDNGLSLAEFTFDTVNFYDLDWYDISIVVGFDYAISIDAPDICGPAANFDVVCHDANCGPPQAYKKSNDDSATHSCNSHGGTYVVTFCP
eukprot:Phypoly_transcript_11809.p1 GENE.Phypoly_transcript_11809~~Phypoly_transcript_11809.p1  ORF type:complete len:207 (+),score=27.93 Phypoly_transcript_11809:519-1139(+)